jgi:hypothetical protein
MSVGRALLLVVLLAGCTSNHETEPPTQAQSSTTSSQSAPGAGSTTAAKECEPEVHVKPLARTVGKRVVLTGECFPSGPHRYERHPGVFLFHVFASPPECELRAAGSQRISVSASGRLHGWLVVPRRGSCFQHDYGRRVTPGRYYVGVGCMACVVERDSLIVTEPTRQPIARTPFARLIAHAFINFAHDPSTKTAAFDTPVNLGLGGRVVVTLGDDDRYAPAKWRLPLTGYAGGSGYVSALRLLIHHAGNLHVSNAPVPACVEHVREWRLTGGGHLVRIQPRYVDSCIEWWSVDLYVNDGNQVVAVNVNLGAP